MNDVIPRHGFESVRSPTKMNAETTRTKVSFQEHVNVLNVMKRYRSTGLLDHQARGEAVYAEFASPDEYLDAVNRVRDAESRFYELPSEVRDQVDNDPMELLRLGLSEDPRDLAKLEELGLAPKPEEPPATPAPSTPPEAPTEPPAPEPSPPEPPA